MGPHLLALLACTEQKAEQPDEPEVEDTDLPSEPSEPSPAGPDADGDGSPDEEDCDDADPTVFPGAPDVCGDDRTTDCTRTSDDGLVTVDGAATFITVGDALSAASEGSVVLVCPGEWLAAVEATVPVDLRSHAGPELTVLDGAGSWTVLAVPGGSRVTGFTLTGGYGDTGGGLLQTTGGTLEVTDCLIEDNSAVYGAGLALAEGSQATLLRTTLRNNRARDAGGGLWIPAGSTAELVESVVERNDAQSGAGVALLDGTLIGGAIAENVASGRDYFENLLGGAGVAAVGVSEIVGADIYDNWADNNGGGISAVLATLTVTDTAVHGNAATYGGGLYAEYGAVALTGTTELTDNLAAIGGGASLFQNTISGGAVRSNEGGYGGGIDLYESHATDMVIEDNLGELGGGVLTFGGSLLRVRLANNRATDVGGGVGGGDFTVTDSEIVDNTSPRGGGLHGWGDLTVQDCSVLRNQAEERGGGAMLESDTLLSSLSSDWGSGPDDNVPGDVFAGGEEHSGWGADASFACGPQGCDLLPD
jgi:hypothetical protein